MRTRRSHSSGDPMSSDTNRKTGSAPGHRPETTEGSFGHRTVLLHEAVEALAIRENDAVADATLGGGGHARAIRARLGDNGRLYAFDADGAAIERGRALFGSDRRVELIHANFRDLAGELSRRGATALDKALFDLGWSGYQLSDGRGFSFLSDEPLSMAYDASQRLTAHEAVNEWSAASLEDILRGWGEERYARRIADAIVRARAKRAIGTARELAEIVSAAVPVAYRHARIHPATKTFQALRIAVNDEMGALAEGLRGAWRLLRPGGRIAVITFHSIEDRLVKQTFAGWEKAGEGKRLTKKPITPTAEDIRDNPRCRSAKLRVITKL